MSILQTKIPAFAGMTEKPKRPNLIIIPNESYMQTKLEQLKTDALLAIKSAKDKIHLEELENKFLGRKNGELTNLLKGLKELEGGARKVVGQVANEVKIAIDAEFANKKDPESRERRVDVDRKCFSKELCRGGGAFD